MANSLKILSWNIQKFGEEKLNDANVINYICAVIKLAQAQVVGLMELVGWQGNETRDKLVATLNNHETLKNTGITWAGEASEMTPARPNEQYLFLWQTNQFQKTEHVLWNVVGEAAFDPFFKKYNISSGDQDKFWQSLFKNGVLDAAFQLKPKTRESITADYRNLDLSKKDPKFDKLTGPEKQDVVNLLLKEQPQTFPLRGSRPPFLLAGKAQPGKQDILFMLFHAPGPGNGLPRVASNQLTVKPVHDAAICVVMGDFNVNSAECGNEYTLQYFDQFLGRLAYVMDAKSKKLFAYPFQRLTGPQIKGTATDPTLATVESYAKRLWDTKTSISTTLVDPTVVADAAAVQGILSSEYDKFFVRAPKADPVAAYAFPTMDAMTPKQVTVPPGVFATRSTTTTSYVSDLASFGKQAFDAWWERQNAKKRKSKELQQMLIDMPKLTTSGTQSLREAHYVYRSAISDHLPIVMELQYA